MDQLWLGSFTSMELLQIPVGVNIQVLCNWVTFGMKLNSLQRSADGSLVQWLAHGPIPLGSGGCCLSSQCRCGFSLRTPVSSHSPKMRLWGIGGGVTLRWPTSVFGWLFLYVSPRPAAPSQTAVLPQLLKGMKRNWWMVLNTFVYFCTLLSKFF